MLMLFLIRIALRPPIWEWLFIRLTVCDYRESLSDCISASFPFGLVVSMWDLVALVADRCLSFYL